MRLDAVHAQRGGLHVLRPGALHLLLGELLLLGLWRLVVLEVLLRRLMLELLLLEPLRGLEHLLQVLLLLLQMLSLLGLLHLRRLRLLQSHLLLECLAPSAHPQDPAA